MPCRQMSRVVFYTLRSEIRQMAKICAGCARGTCGKKGHDLERIRAVQAQLALDQEAEEKEQELSVLAAKRTPRPRQGRHETPHRVSSRSRTRGHRLSR